MLSSVSVNLITGSPAAKFNNSAGLVVPIPTLPPNIPPPVNEPVPLPLISPLEVMLPDTSAGISGIGQTPLGLVEGSHVFGFFRDGEARQEPVVMGSLPGYPTELANTDTGFYDPNGEFPRYKNAPDTTQLATMIEYNPLQHASITADLDVFN